MGEADGQTVTEAALLALPTEIRDRIRRVESEIRKAAQQGLDTEELYDLLAGRKGLWRPDREIDFPSLLAALASRKYPDPARYRNRPQNPFEVEVSDPPVYDEGTWDEVVRARNVGLLTQDEYMALAEAAWKRAHQEAPSPVPAATGPARAQHDGRAAPARSPLSKARLQQQVAEAAGLNKAQAGRAVDAVLNSIESALKKGEEVRLTGFGSFRVTHTKARTGRNPRTGKTTSIAQGKRPSFSPGSRLKQAVTGQKAG